MINFAGNVERGRIPAIRAVHCREPLSTAQLNEALALWRESLDDLGRPRLFFFFDFDGTLSLQQGLEQRFVQGASSVDPVLATLFGDEARQAALRALMQPLLEARRCFVLTANSGYAAIAHLLNLLLARGMDPNIAAPRVLFAVDKSVLYVPSGQKISRINRIVDASGCKLMASF